MTEVGWKLWRHLNSRKRIGKVVLVGFAITIAVAGFLPMEYIYTPASISLPVSIYGGTRLTSYPTVTYKMDVLFAAAGSFSVGNPVHVRVDMFDVNNSNVLNAYCCATLSGALNIPPIHGMGKASGSVFADRIILTPYPNGSYIGSDWINFVEAGGQGISLLPPANLTNPASIITVPGFKGGIPYPFNLSTSMSEITISDSSATLSIESTGYIARITLLIGAFSVILLQPVLEAVLLPERPKNQPEQLPTQAQPSQHSMPPRPTESPGQMRRRLRREEESRQKRESQNPPPAEERKRES